MFNASQILLGLCLGMEGLGQVSGTSERIHLCLYGFSLSLSIPGESF